MFSLLNNIIFNVAFVFFIFMIQCSTSSPLENRKLAQLIERLDRMQTKMDFMQTKMDFMQNKMDNMQSREELLEAENVKLTEQLGGIRKRVEGLEVENEKWTSKFGDLEAENQKLKSQMSHPKFPLSPTKWDDRQSSKVLSSPPTSCQELKNQNGLWPMDGIHLLKKENKIKAAFCTFAADGSPVSEALIGQVDIKTKTVHFYVQKTIDFITPRGNIPFELARLNEGGAFNLTSGMFTVPVPGIYHFDFSGLKDSSADILTIKLKVNGVAVGLAFTRQNGSGTSDVVSLSASFRLAVGDTVNMYKENGALWDSQYHYTHFSGWLVEEELI